MDSITTEQLLAYMMQNGFSWIDSDIEGMDLIKKGAFKWYLTSERIHPLDLIKVIEHEALNRGLKR